MKTIEVSEEIYDALEDLISCDAENHSQVIQGLFDLISMLMRGEIA